MAYSAKLVKHLESSWLRGFARALLPHIIRHRAHSLLINYRQNCSLRNAFLGTEANLEDIALQCIHSVKPISSPLILISQVQRSGGTFLSQLFDGHKNILAHPHELKIGYPQKYNWPPIQSDMSSDKLFDTLFERTNISLMKNGYTKGESAKSRYRFFLPPMVQKRIFQSILKNQSKLAIREILNSYFTSYFNAWLNYKGSIEEGRYITAFVPQMANSPDNIDQFFATYPDGYLISILREPTTWYASASRHNSKIDVFGKVDTAMKYWCENADSMIRNKKRYKDRVILMHFETLVGNPRSTMMSLSDHLGIPFSNSLINPTFNGVSIAANSSFSKESNGILTDAIDRTHHVTENDKRIIKDETTSIYKDVKQLVEI